MDEMLVDTEKTAAPESSAEKYKCECIKCGHKMESGEHCKELKCPKCEGQMRREERPGPGQADYSCEMRTKTIRFKVDQESVTESGEFEGYGSVFDVLDMQEDIVVRGAFKLSLEAHETQGTTVKMLWQHDRHEPIGVWSEASEDDRGLKLKGQIVMDVQRGREAYALLKAGALDGLSIGYMIKRSETDEETNIRKLLEIHILEVSLVTFPANTAARVTRVKCNSIRDLEHTLRDAGFSLKEAKAIASHGYKGLNLRDVDEEALKRVAAHLENATSILKGE